MVDVCPEFGFFNVRPLFCEAKYLAVINFFGKDSKTEIVGSASNLAYVIFGLFAHYASRRADPLIKMECALVFAVGIGSTLYHMTGFYGFGHFDGLPMLLLVGVVFLAVLEDTVIDKLEPENPYDVCVCTLREWASAFVYVFTFAYILFALVMNTVSDPTIDFDLLFAIPIFALCILMLYTFREEKKVAEKAEKEEAVAEASRLAQESKTQELQSLSPVAAGKDKPQQLPVQTHDLNPEAAAANTPGSLDPSPHDTAVGRPTSDLAVEIQQAVNTTGQPLEVVTIQKQDSEPKLYTRGKHKRTASMLLRTIKGRDVKKTMIGGPIEYRNDVKMIALRAVLFMGVGFVCRWVDIEWCRSGKYPYSVYFFGHGWWHILSGYAAHCIVCFSSYLRADLFMRKPTLHWYPRCLFTTLGIKMIPTVEWDDDDRLIGILEHSFKEYLTDMPAGPSGKFKGTITQGMNVMRTFASGLADRARTGTVAL